VRILLGIGNPGNKYIQNRHNAGFMMLDYLADSLSLSFKPSKYDYYFSEGEISSNNFVLIKPTTYVNNTGIAALQAVNKYEVALQDFLVIVDDLNLELSKLRIRQSGGDGGHNGISSIIYHLSSDQFPRLRIGIGSEFNKGEMAGYVLQDFNEEEKKILENTFKVGSILLEDFIKGGFSQMLDTNSRLALAKKDNNILNQTNGDQENL
jgi:PTH1 family peptidyl-tRNA hydrolase